jgi:hypothetical protein
MPEEECATFDQLQTLIPADAQTNEMGRPSGLSKMNQNQQYTPTP